MQYALLLRWGLPHRVRFFFSKKEFILLHIKNTILEKLVPTENLIFHEFTTIRIKTRQKLCMVDTNHFNSCIEINSYTYVIQPSFWHLSLDWCISPQVPLGNSVPPSGPAWWFSFGEQRALARRKFVRTGKKINIIPDVVALGTKLLRKWSDIEIFFKLLSCIPVGCFNIPVETIDCANPDLW